VINDKFLDFIKKGISTLNQKYLFQTVQIIAFLEELQNI
jgi:hypothetical protein